LKHSNDLYIFLINLKKYHFSFLYCSVIFLNFKVRLKKYAKNECERKKNLCQTDLLDYFLDQQIDYSHTGNHFHPQRVYRRVGRFLDFLKCLKSRSFQVFLIFFHFFNIIPVAPYFSSNNSCHSPLFSFF